MSVNDKQVGGEHYRSKVQHWDYVELNGLRYTEGCATKYATRNRKKGHQRQDLEKAIHYVEKVQDLHRNGYLHPRTAPMVVSLVDFVESNELTENEAEVVRILTYWEADPELTRALEILREMIEELN